MDAQNNRFSIWALNSLQDQFEKEINKLNINYKLKKKILNYEKEKIQICRLNLNNNYKPIVIYDKYSNNIYIHHTWNDSIFDIDHFSEQYGLLSQQSIEYTLSNIFDLLLITVIHNTYMLYDANIQAIIILLYPFARFNYPHFKFLIDNFPDKKFVDKVSATLTLYDLKQSA